MYSIEIHNGDETVEIHSPYPDDIKLEKAEIQRALNSISTLEFMVMPDIVLEAEYLTLSTKVTVYDTKTMSYRFKGRILDPEDVFDEDGYITKSFFAESELAYLKDSLTDYKKYDGYLHEVVPQILAIHNSMTDDYQHFSLGTYAGLENFKVSFWTTPEMSTWEVILYEIAETYDLIFDYSEIDGDLKLNFYKKVGELSETDIELAENLISMTKESKASDVVTRLIPLGERIVREDIKDNDVPQDRVDISSVNGGLKYIDDPLLQAQFGGLKKVGYKIFEGVVDPAELFNKGLEWRDEQRNNLVLNHYEIEVLNLWLIDEAPEDFVLGNYHRVINELNGVDETLQIIGTVEDLIIPSGPGSNSKITIGDKWLSLEEYQKEALIYKRRLYKFEEQWFRQNEINKIEKEEIEEVNRIQAEEILKLEEVTANQEVMIDDLQTITSNQGDMIAELSAITTEIGQEFGDGGTGIKGRLNGTWITANNAYARTSQLITALQNAGIPYP